MSICKWIVKWPKEVIVTKIMSFTYIEKCLMQVERIYINDNLKYHQANSKHYKET